MACTIHQEKECKGINGCGYDLECAKIRKEKIIKENHSKGITWEKFHEESRKQNPYAPFTCKRDWELMKQKQPYWPYNTLEEFKNKYTEDPDYLLRERPSCSMEELQKLINKEEEVENMSESIGSVNKYFNYQKDINMYKNKLTKLENLQKDLIDEIKTDVETILIAYNYNELGTKIKITNNGLKIRIPVKVYNDYDICYKIDTDLFTQLNKLMGMHGKLNIENKTKFAGDMVYHIELIYELEKNEEMMSNE